MSIHISLPQPAQAVTAQTAQRLPPSVLPDSWSFGEAFSLRLDHLGVVVAIAPTVLEPETRRVRIALHAVREGGALPVADTRLGAVPSPGAAMMEDPVVHQLTCALEAAERGSDPFSGLYADALRLAVVTRVFGTAGDQAIERPQVEIDEVPQQQRTKSGLVKWRLKRVVTYIDEHLSGAVTLADMAVAAGLSRMHFSAQFRRATGLRPHEYLVRRRIERAQDLLRETREPLVQVALAVGFQTQAHFTTVFRRITGETPYQWRCAHAE
ncbi:AraC family transcriptional regulator [Beijerinckia mobilis]|uniref:AraC family transcriptional regulator n=1 Tax=Beijerinckia mobilis TaxID=231434 RepID=UPI0006924141|nr:AraC family transcriptional regulator [Beijerinckia mobilis]